MKKSFMLLLFVVGFAHAQESINEFPKRPLHDLTPGTLCTTPTSYRYPENIAYCERHVTTQTKEEIFDEYRRAGYGIRPGTRGSYKIDHLIPLCAGGSNDKTNLWPQHITIFELTDPIEGLACSVMKQGKIKQADAIALILGAKYDNSKVDEVINRLTELARSN